jgi:hypothetical protein
MFGKILSWSCAAGLAASAATAATVDVTFQVPGQSFGAANLQQSVTISTPNDPTFQNGGLYDGTAGAGQFQLNGGATLGDFAAFCVELAQVLQGAATYTISGDLFEGRILASIDRLFSVAYDSVDTSLEASAFQVALWEIVHDDGPSYDLGTGNVRISGNAAVTDQASAYLDALSGAETGRYDILFLSSPVSQDIVTARLRLASAEAPPAVPVPAAIWFLVGGIGGLGVMLRTRRT